MKKILGLILMLSLILQATCLSYGNSIPEGPPTIKGMYKHLDIGAFYIWGANGKWDPVAPESSPKVTANLTFPKDVYIVDVYPYSSDKFDWNDKEYNTYNATPYLFDEVSFKDNYLLYKAQIGEVSSVGSKGTNVKLSYNANLSGKGLDINLYANPEKIEEFYAMMGGKEAVKQLSPITAQRIDEAVKNGLGDMPEGRVYFLPVIIEYSLTPLPECTKCKICKVDKTKGENCNKDTCNVFNTPDCGCYVVPEIPQVTPPADSNGCSTVIKWSEIAWHAYSCGGCKKSPKGGKSCPGHNCNHVYTYQTNLSSTATVNPGTLKSGYGFAVTASNTISTKQISNAGACGSSKSKVNSKKPVPPAAVEVRTNWTVKNRLGTQPANVPLVKTGGTTTTSNFGTAANKISEKKAKQIYTNVALKGTAKAPVNHSVKIVISGGGVNGIQYCNTLTKSIKINGNMYEDDWTVDRRK